MAGPHRIVTTLLLVGVSCGDADGGRATVESTGGQTSADATSSGTSETSPGLPTTETSASSIDTTSSQEPAEPPETCAYGRFQASGDVSGQYDWTSENNLVMCRKREDVEGWLLRLAEDPASDGAAGLHLELNLYFYDEEGEYLPHPYPQWPPEPRTFDLFLRLPSGAPHYVNVPSSTDCATTVTYADTQWIAGAFHCNGLVYFGAAPDLGRTVDVGDGGFCCERPP